MDYKVQCRERLRSPELQRHLSCRCTSPLNPLRSPSIPIDAYQKSSAVTRTPQQIGWHMASPAPSRPTTPGTGQEPWGLLALVLTAVWFSVAVHTAGPLAAWLSGAG